ncbi:MAG: hypothetical protein ABIN94_22810 [Ferruginibacter sp.]
MNKRIYIAAAISFFFAVTAFRNAEDIIARLGMNASAAQNFILGNLTGDFNSQIESYPQEEDDLFRIPYSKKILPAIIAGDKAKAAEELCGYIKMYCNSNEFINEYNKRRISALPLSDNGVSPGTLKHNIEVYQTNIKNYKTNEKYVEEQQTLLDADQLRLNKFLEKAQGTFPLKKEWEEAYPADAAILVKRRLQEYLSLTASVDFNAKLTEPDRYNKRKFANPVHEKKSQKWKAIYRAGKEVNDVVTTFVKEWLKGEIISKEKASMSANIENAKPAATENKEGGDVKTSDATPQTDALPEKPMKSKKSLLDKIKNKAKAVVN